MHHKVLDFTEKYKMLSPDCGIIVGLSGGADSVALLCCLNNLRDRWNGPLAACHINHQIRGPESDRDQIFCESLCQRLGIPLITMAVNVPVFAGEHGMGLEEAARELRYSCFFQAAERWRGQTGLSVVKIATAHTLSDSLETVLFAAARGTGLSGLCGIPPVRSSLGQPDVIRPLLEVTRTETEEYCRENGLDYVTDSSNFDEAYTRNMIRRRIVPLLREINPGVEQAAARMTSSLREDRDCLEGLAEEFIKKRQIERKEACLAGVFREDWLKLPQAVAVRVIRQMLGCAGISCDWKMLSLCCRTAHEGRGAVEAGKGIFLKADTSRIWLEQKWEPLPYFESQVQWGDPVYAAGKVYVFRLLDYEQTEKFKKISRNRLKNCLDYDRIYGIVKVRQKKDGDAYTPWGRKGSRSLKKLFQETGVSPFERSRLAVLEDEIGILWVERTGCCERVAPGPGTRRLLEISVQSERDIMEAEYDSYRNG